MSRLAAAAWLLGFGSLVACGPSLHGAATSRPLDEDPVALLPSGADLVADLDVEQLRQWPPSRRFLQLLPEAARARLERVGFTLDDVDEVVVSVSQLGAKEASSTLVLKGELDLDKLRNGLGPPSEVTDNTYREAHLAEGPEGSMARVLPKLVVLASPAEVRRVIDLVRGEGESVRASASDRHLMAAFDRAPTAKSGRPAIRLAAVPSEPMREELKKLDLPGVDLDWLALSVAVGDGFDVGGVGGLKGPAEAESMANTARARVSEFSGRMAVRLLGLKQYIEPIVFKARDSEVHFAYRLSAPTVTQMLDRLESVSAARPQAPQAAPARAPEKQLDR